MKSFVKVIVVSLLAIFFIILFLPKENFYYLFEKKLYDSKNIVLNSEKIDDKFLYLDIKDLDILLDNAFIGNIKEIDVLPFVLYNKIFIKNIRVSNKFKKLLPRSIESAKIDYSILNPLKINIALSGKFGRVVGFIHLKDKKIYLELHTTKKYSNKRFVTNC